MRLIDADALKEKIGFLSKGYPYAPSSIEDILNIIDNAPTVEPEKVLIANVTFEEDKLKEIVQKEVIDKIKSGEIVLKDERLQDEWVRKEDVIHSIAKQYSEHNELVPIWLSIGDMKGDAE